MRLTFSALCWLLRFAQFGHCICLKKKKSADPACIVVLYLNLPCDLSCTLVFIVEDSVWLSKSNYRCVCLCLCVCLIRCRRIQLATYLILNHRVIVLFILACLGAKHLTVMTMMERNSPFLLLCALEVFITFQTDFELSNLIGQKALLIF